MALSHTSFEVLGDEKTATEWELVIENTGDDGLLKLGSFEFDLSEGYDLRWFKVDPDGNLWGPERIAGVVGGRESFPAIIDITTGMGITLVLQWRHPETEPLSGELRWKTNSPNTPVLIIPINGSDRLR